MGRLRFFWAMHGELITQLVPHAFFILVGFVIGIWLSVRGAGQ